MTITITLPDYLTAQLQRRAADEHRSVEALALTYIETGLMQTAPPPSGTSKEELAHDPEILALVARIKATPRNPVRVIPSQQKLAELLAVMVVGEPDQTLLDALDAAEAELRAINRADDIAEGRG